MSDEPFAISPSAPPPPTEADYEAIHAAVMETVRGRWFLTEFAKRNRHADTALVLAAIDRVEALWHQRRAVSSAERVRFDLVEMAQAIAQTRTEIAAIKPDGDAKGSLSEATEELDSIVQTTEKATSDILAAAEQVQEIAWTLRERGADHDSCDALDQRATDIYSACSFQDLTGQRSRKVVEVLRFLEDRIRAMIAIWGDTVPAPSDAASAPHLGRDEAEQLGQTEIDQIMPAADAPAPLAPAANSHAGSVEPALATNAVAAPAVEIGETAMPDIAAAAASGQDGAVSAESLETMDLGFASAIVGATALALDPSPFESAPAPETLRARELADEPEPAAASEPQAGLDTQAEEVATADGERSDPAAMLKRILALIRAPNGASVAVEVADPPSGAPGDETAGMVMTVAVAELPADDATPGSVPTYLAEISVGEPSVAEPSVAEAPVAEASVAEPPIAEAPVAEPPVAEPPVAEPPVAVPPVAIIPVAQAPVVEVPQAVVVEAPAAPAEPAAGGEVEAAADILVPLSGPLTVEQAVDELLGKTRRNGPLPQPVPAPTAEPTAAVEAALPAAIAAPHPPAAEPIERAENPFTLDVPDLPVAPPPVAPAAPEPAPVAQQAAPEPPPLEPLRAESLPPAEELPAPDETPIAPTAAASPPAALAESAAAIMPTAAPFAPPVLALVDRPLPPQPAARYHALAAIAALSDDEKIALFS